MSTYVKGRGRALANDGGLSRVTLRVKRSQLALYAQPTRYVEMPANEHVLCPHAGHSATPR
jgi:hypothetical protein